MTEEVSSSSTSALSQSTHLHNRKKHKKVHGPITFSENDVTVLTLTDKEILIVITDLHINKTDKFDSDVGSILDHLRALINLHNPTAFICLGDLIHRNPNNTYELWINFFTQLEQLAIHIHIISGNHDRRYSSEISNHWNGCYVHWYHHISLIRVESIRKQLFRKPVVYDIYLGHDVKQTHVGDTFFLAINWVKNVRHELQSFINQNLLILGHVHNLFLHKGEDGTVATLSPFSPNLGDWSYGIIERQPDCSISFTAMNDGNQCEFISIDDHKTKFYKYPDDE